jgi:hypothetical protein
MNAIDQLREMHTEYASRGIELRGAKDPDVLAMWLDLLNIYKAVGAFLAERDARNPDVNYIKSDPLTRYSLDDNPITEGNQSNEKK